MVGEPVPVGVVLPVYSNPSGARCDVPAIVYSHSQFPNPNWTESHPERDEIQKCEDMLAGSPQTGRTSPRPRARSPASS